jgi:hypothetical protein
LEDTDIDGDNIAGDFNDMKGEVVYWIEVA